jgi:GTPase SAR1 family protein
LPTDHFQTIATDIFNYDIVVFLVYDCTSRESFRRIESLLKSDLFARSYNVLVVNKTDQQNFEVEHEEGQTLANKYKLKFEMVSAKTGHGVKNMFESSIATLKERKRQALLTELELADEEPRATALDMLYEMLHQ